MCIQASTPRGRQGKKSFVTPAAFREHLVANRGSKFENPPSLGTRGWDQAHACEDVKFRKKSFKMICVMHGSTGGQ